MDGELALSYIWQPSAAVTACEQNAPASLIRQRAYDNGRK